MWGRAFWAVNNEFKCFLARAMGVYSMGGQNSKVYRW